MRTEVLVLLLLAACQTPVTAPPSELPSVRSSASTQPDFVIILVSGLRADKPDSHGGAEEQFVEALGSYAPDVRFSAAYTQSSSSFVSLGSILVGRYPSAIPMCGLFTGGVKGVLAPTVQPHAVENRLWCAQIPAQARTLPEVLGLYGYRTALATSGLAGADLLTHGFEDRGSADFHADGGTDWEALGQWTRTWWTSHSGSPRLLMVVTEDLQVADRSDLLSSMGLHASLEDMAQFWDDGRPDPSIVFRASQVYADAAHRAGLAVRGILDGLPSSSTGPARYTFIGSTHGVSLTETGGFERMAVPEITTSYVLDRTVHVPLLVYGPLEGLPKIIPSVVEYLDLMPTLLRLGGAVAPVGLSGSDLLVPSGETPSFAYAEFGDSLFLRYDRRVLEFRAFLHNGTALDPQLDERLVSKDNTYQRFSLYDVVIDPDQENDLLRRGDRAFPDMFRSMLAIRQGSAAPPRDTWDDPSRLWELRMARSQGYW
jgi:arylsulfatase A-like enzyme